MSSLISSFNYGASDDTDVVESVVFLLKMTGDYNRYRAEVMDNEHMDIMDMTDMAKVARIANDAYVDALTASKKLKLTNPVPLAVVFNYSVFLYEIMNEPKEACMVRNYVQLFHFCHIFGAPY